MWPLVVTYIVSLIMLWIGLSMTVSLLKADKKTQLHLQQTICPLKIC
jgi:hypothetical protein